MNSKKSVYPKEASTFIAKILVAEDNPVNQIIAEEVLSGNNCEVTIANNGKVAVEYACQENFDLILMDIQMPVMDGCEATTAIREHEKENDLKHSPIVAVTANTMVGDRERFINCGMDDYLSKPFDQKTIDQLIAKWIKIDDKQTPILNESSKQIQNAKHHFNHLDSEVFNRFKSHYDGSRITKFFDLIEIYKKSSKTNIEGLFSSVKAHNFDKIKQHSHSMKSSCAYFGATHLVDLYKTLELLATNHDTKRIEEQLNSIVDETVNVNSDLDNFIEQSAIEQKVSNSTTQSNQSNQHLPHILLIDDDNVTRSIARDTLEANGFNVSEASNGQEGISIFKDLRPDLVLMDVEMPIVNGYEACEIIRSESINYYIPVVMVTGNEGQESVERCYASGATDFESKPVNWSVLLPRLKFILRSAENVRKLEVSQKRLNNAQQIGNIGHWDLNLVNNDIFLSKQLYSIIGIKPHEDVQTLKSLLQKTDLKNRKLVCQKIRDAASSNKSFSFDHEIRLPNGKQRIIHQEGEASYAQDGTPQTIHSVVQDVTERRESEKIIAHQAYHDSLTGLSNRKSFNDQLELALDLAQRQDLKIAVLYLDIDGFKRINDSLGHHIGDKLLKEISERLIHTIRESDRVYRHVNSNTHTLNDTTIARLGGDEFTIMLTGVHDTSDVELVSKRICKAFSIPFNIIDGNETYDLHVTSSIGICITDNKAISAETLQKHADIAMYHSKKAGKNTYRFYDDSMNVKSDGSLEMETRLRGAIANNELKLYYQPKVDIVTGELVGMEALLRWFSPELGFVSPVDFIPLSEQSGLILPISNWVLEAACRQNKAWQDAGFEPVTVAVNLSSVQFYQTDFLHTVKEIIDQSHLPPETLELELTEGLLMNDTEEVITILNSFRDMGLKISIDDFGTGYSSLSYLKRFPLDYLKIDRSFVMDIGKDTDDEAITSAIIAMSHSLKLQVIAEGVENEEQLEFLQRQGCDQFQGYYFSPPVPAEEMVSFLRHKDSRALEETIA